MSNKSRNSALFSIIGFLLFIVACMLACSSCVVTQKQRDRFCSHCPQKIKDSIRVEKTVEHKDTTIFITKQGPIQYLENPCKELCDSLGKLKPFVKEEKKNGIKSTIKTVGNSLVFDSEADSLKEVIKGLNQTIKETREKTETKFIKLPCEREHRKWYDKITFWWFIISVPITGLYIYFKFKK